MQELLIIANGRITGHPRWERAVRRLRDFPGGRVEVRTTRGRGDATFLAREALSEGARWLAAAGGDGTINEVVNGFFDGGVNAHPDATLSFLPCGTANDWARTMEIPLRLEEAIGALSGAEVRSVDVGIAEFPAAGYRRAFLNFAEIGAGSEVIRRMEAAIGRGRRSGYLLTAIAAAFSYQPRRLDISVDGRTPLPSEPLLSFVAAGGRYFGSGIQVAPMARPDDGLLELISIGDFGKMEVLARIARFVRGDYFGESKVRHWSAASAEVSAAVPTAVVLDGELAGELPVRIRTLPQALRVRC